MFKKNKIGNCLYKKEIIPFGSINDYICDYTNSGDYIIPVCGDCDSGFEGINDIHDNPANPNEYIRQYDERLVRIYRHQDDNVVLKNIKMLNGIDPKNMGLKGKIDELCNKLDKLVEEIPSAKRAVLCSLAKKWYDGIFRDKNTGNKVKSHIWIPVWDINPENAIVVSLFERINLIIS